MTSINVSDSLVDKILAAISNGCRNFLIWWAGTTGIRVLARLEDYHLSNYICGVVDPRTFMQGEIICSHKIIPPATLKNLDFDTLVITFDTHKESALEEFSSIDSRIPNIIIAGNTNYDFNDATFHNTLKSCPVKSKAGGYPNMLIHLYQTLKYISNRQLKGDIAEFGVYQGGTTVFMAKALKQFGHPGIIYGFDTFQGFPRQHSSMDIYRDTKVSFMIMKLLNATVSPITSI